MENRRTTDDHGERLARLEEQLIASSKLQEAGFKSLGRSVDEVRSLLTSHLSEEKELAKKVDEIEKDFDELKGGAKLFFKMAAIMVIISGGIWSAATWVAGKG